MPATLHDIARKAGLSVSTVSRVLNGKADEYHIREETRQIVFETARELDYRPNPLARGLRLHRTQSLGLVMPDVSNPFFAHVTRRVQNVAYSLGYSLIVCNTNEDVRLEIEHIQLLTSNRVDGMLIMPVGQRFDHIEKLAAGGTPLVLVDRSPDNLNAHSVVLDNFRGGFMGTEHLVQHGHRDIGILQGVPTNSSEKRIQGYRAALEKYGIPARPELTSGGAYQEQTGYISTQALLSLDRPPTAIFATGVSLALGAYRAILERGLRIPEDISVVTFDDFEAAPFLACPLTAVAQPREAMAEAAVHLLVEQVQHGTPAEPKRVVFTPHLIIRRSVRYI